MPRPAKYILEISWDAPKLPRLVGPFDSEQEAVDWGRLNIPNGSWNVALLAEPYQIADTPASVDAKLKKAFAIAERYNTELGRGT